MDKTAIKNFAIWARNKLMSDMRVRAGFLGITDKAVVAPLPASTSEIQYFHVSSGEPVKIQGAEIQMRERVVAKLEQHAKESGYQTAYNSLIESMASVWFNRLIAIRYMEVNEYFPDQLRVLSSVSEGKQDPDIVSRPFDSDLEFTVAERRQVNDWLDANELNELFRFLLFKRCNQLAECLPGLFEKQNDESEFFLRLSFVEKDGLIYHLVHDIEENAWRDQVQIIGWMYQYYNTEPKAAVFDRKPGTKIKKEDVPAATQLFTPDWIVRYMVENSLGRLWVEGHPDEELKSHWRYYLEEAEQEPEVQVQLDEIRGEYTKLQPEDIRCVDPCMGSGHILVYLFEVLMQIYESQGYTKREAAQSILKNNLYGLDIDDRASQLAYFSVMMKARQYDRRIFTRGIQPHVYAVEESNGFRPEHLKYFGGDLNPLEKNNAINQAQGLIESLQDAREYGSILCVEPMDWELLRRFADCIDFGGQMNLDAVGIDQTQILLKKLINVGEILSQQYDVTVTNPPYMAVSNASLKVQNFVKKNYPDSKADMFAVFIERCGEMTAKNRYQAMITQHAWMFLSSFEKLRKKLLLRDIVNMAHLGARAFDDISGEVVQTTSFVIRRSFLEGYNGTYCRLIEPNTQQGKEKVFLTEKKRYVVKQTNFAKILGSPVSYWASDAIYGAFENSESLGKIASPKKGLATTDNARFLRMWFEVNNEKMIVGCKTRDDALLSQGKWFPLNKGGEFRRWYGNKLYVINWEKDGNEIKNAVITRYNGGSYTKEIRNEDKYFKDSITWSALTAGTSSFRLSNYGAIFDSAGSSMFPLKYTYYILGLLNTKITNEVLSIINPTLNYGAGSIAIVPVIVKQNFIQDVEIKVEECISLSQIDWDSFETSWDFKQHPLVYYSKGLWDATAIAATMSYYYGGHPKVNSPLELCYMLWQGECNERFKKLKANEEELNRIFIDIYGLQDELTPEVEEKDVTVRKADLGRDIRSLLSYAVGCMFGRYSLDSEGLAYAGGEWNAEKYTTFTADEDNVIPITDQKYMDDDIVERLCEFLKVVYGEEKLEENLDFIASALGGNGSSSREVIRKYFLNDFFKDHCRIYQKRPIYWLFDSGKQNGFKALVYMHRWDKNSIGRVLVYLHRIQEKYEIEVRAIDALIRHITDRRQEAVEERRRDHLLKQIAEIKEYDERLEHMANEYIDIDLDDGVKVNYDKVQTDRHGVKYQILAPIK